MAEEHRCQAPEGHCLCSNNYSFFSSPTTMNLCSKCYRDHCLKEQQHASIKSTVQTSLSAPSSSLSPAVVSPSSPPALILLEVTGNARPPEIWLPTLKVSGNERFRQSTFPVMKVPDAGVCEDGA